MKKIILIIAFISISVLSKAQCNQPYRAFSTFANDTTAFLQYNFKTRADCYKGKTVAQVLADLQLTPRSYTPSPSIYTGKYQGITIHIDNTTINERLQNPKRKTQYIYIYPGKNYWIIKGFMNYLKSIMKMTGIRNIMIFLRIIL